MKNTSIWTKYNKKELKELETFTDSYVNFISNNKTERECVDTIVSEIEAEGYVNINKAIAAGKKLNKKETAYLAKKEADAKALITFFSTCAGSSMIFKEVLISVLVSSKSYLLDVSFALSPFKSNLPLVSTPLEVQAIRPFHPLSKALT